MSTDRIPNREQTGGREPGEPLGLDVYSVDGQLVGRVGGFAGDPEQENAVGMAWSAMDTLSWQESFEHARRVLVDGHGYITQAEFSVPIDQIDFDLRSRRATLRLTMAEIERIPHRDPNAGALGSRLNRTI